MDNSDDMKERTAENTVEERADSVGAENQEVQEEKAEEVLEDPNAVLKKELKEEIKREIEAELPKPKKKKHLRRNIILGAIVVVGLIGALTFRQIAQSVVDYMLFSPFEYTPEIEAELCPIDEERAAAIDAMPHYDSSDTWAFYYYVVGSNLESGTVSQLSDMTNYLIEDEKNAVSNQMAEERKAHFAKIHTMLTDNHLDFPQAFFQPETAEGTEESAGSTEAPEIKALISDGNIRQLMDLELPENVKIVLQTGGAGAWDLTQINPNRSQRFLLEAGDEGLQEISNKEIVDMGDEDSIADFLEFCRSNYPADHEVVCFVDHGGASSGFGLDENYGDIASLSDIKGAFAAVCQADESNPPFEMIDFQCCLMSSAEVASYLKGFARYMTCAEETTFSYLRDSGIEMTRPLNEAMEGFLQDTSENGAMLGRRRADAYAKYMVYGGQTNGLVFGSDTGVLDLTKAGKVYVRYNDLAKKMLEKAIQDPAWLATYTHAANASIFMAGDSFKAYNTLDLEIFMQNLAPYFPDETKAVIDAIEDSVLYRRTSNYMNGTYGISIYFPAHMEGTGGLSMMMEYLETVTDSPDIQALYYYKAFGCMPEDLKQYCKEAGYGDVKAIDFSAMDEIAKLPVETDGTQMSVELIKEQAAVTAMACQEFGQVDEENEVIKYYGRDQYIGLDGEDHTKVVSDFDNKWMTLNGQLLYLQVINSTDKSITYVTPINYQGVLDRELLLSYDFETEKVSILGMKKIGVDADTLDVSLEALEKGDLIAPIHYETALSGENLEAVAGDIIKVDDNLKLEEVTVPDGKYIERIVFTDLRSDEYYTHPICFTMKDGTASEVEKAPSTIYFTRIWE